MNIKRLKICHFRGIDQLDWDIAGRLVCLIGPGDSTKSTILEAIELALTPRRSVSFDDADFYNADTDNLILIEVTVGGSDRTARRCQIRVSDSRLEWKNGNSR